MSRTARPRIVAAAILIAAAFLHPAAAFAAEESDAATTWAITPVAVDGGDRVSLRHELDPGGGATDGVVVTNFSEHAATFRVYASDGVVTDGGFDLLAPDQVAVDGGSWIVVGAAEGAQPSPLGGQVVSLAPQTSIELPVTLGVPSDATPGDHPAGIVAELVPDADADVQIANRVGVRVHLRVTGDIVGALAPRGIEIDYTPSWNPFAPGRVTVTYAVENVGNVRLGAETSASLTGPLGLSSGVGESEIREVLPAQEESVTAQFEVWPLFIGWGSVDVTPAVVGDDVVETASGGTTEFTVWTIPWSQLALVVVVAGVVVAIVLARRRSARRLQSRIDDAVAAARAEIASPEPTVASR